MYLSESKENWQGKRIIMRIDADVDLREEKGEYAVDEDFRLKTAIPTLKYLFERGVKRVVMIGHMGRPDGKQIKELSLKPVVKWFSENFKTCDLIPLHTNKEEMGEFCMLENLRFDKGEEDNSFDFINELAVNMDIYINEAFGVSHREHASIVGLPRVLRAYLGLRFEGEMRSLSFLKNKARRPLTFVLGGSKKDKLGHLEFLETWADKLLIGGMLPKLIEEQGVGVNSEKVILAELKQDGKDISETAIKVFDENIKKGQTIVVAGPLGVYEENGNETGTFAVYKQISESDGFKIAGGGDTHRVLSRLNYWDKFDFVSVGGGAMMEFLKDEALPGIEAINNR